MKADLITLLETFKYPVRLQGSFSETEAYPASFFTIWNDETADLRHYDNNTIAFTWRFTINFYSTDPTLVNSTLVSVRTLLRENGWIVGGKGNDIPCDEPTHTGRSIDAVFVERNLPEIEEEES